MPIAQSVLIGLVRGYRLLFKAWVGPVCRYEPSCSAYALEALQRHGAWQGGTLAAWRVLRCNPWSHGGHDPVPSCTCRGPFTRLLEPSAMPPQASPRDPPTA